jgi:hypothetical protein
VKLKALRSKILEKKKLGQESIVRAEIESFVGEECIFCGDLMIKDISVALAPLPNVL